MIVKQDDARQWLAARAGVGAAVVVYDPPYAVGTPVRGKDDGAAGSVFAPFGFLHETLRAAKEALRDGGVVLVFADWRRMADMGYLCSTVGLPLGSSADVKWRNAPGNTPTMRYTAGGIAPAGALSALAGGGIQSAGAPGAAIGLDPSGTLYTDLSTATAATINAIRTAFQVQRLLERDARGGTRYTEIIRSHFGVVSPDSRLQRPEYLGGSSVPVNIAPVAQTSASAISGSATPRLS